MDIENPVAFSFIFQEDIYLLNNDKPAFAPNITAAAAPVLVSETPGVSFDYLGQCKKNFLIIVYYPGLEFMAASHLAALQSTLKRLAFSLDDTAILNSATYPDVSLAQLAGFFAPQKMVILGRQALPPGMETLQLNKPVAVNKCRTLFTFSFDEMMDNNEYKKAFWEQMKQL